MPTQVPGEPYQRITVDEASKMLSGLSRCAGFVVAPKLQNKIKHIDIRIFNANFAIN